MMEFLLVEADERAPQQLRRKALDLTDSLIAKLDANGPRDGKSIHDARRRLKELRALTSILRNALPRGGKAERKFFRDAGRELSGARGATTPADAYRLATAVLYTWGLSRNGMANSYYAAAVRAVPETRSALLQSRTFACE